MLYVHERPHGSKKLLLYIFLHSCKLFMMSVLN